MSDRFFSPTPITADALTLDGPEAHHLLHVMRAAVGDASHALRRQRRRVRRDRRNAGRSDADLRIVGAP